MVRLTRTLAAFGLGLMMIPLSGCRSTKSEVPPGRPFASDGRQRKAIEFSSEGHPMSAAASNNFLPNKSAGAGLASGIPAGISRPDPSAFGAPSGSYGGPGTSGLGQPPVLDRSPSDPATLPASIPPANSPAPAQAPVPDLEVPRPTDSTPAPNQVIQAPMEIPGAMGRPDQMPSPN